MRIMGKKSIDILWNGFQKFEFIYVIDVCPSLSCFRLNRLVAMLDERTQKSAKNSFSCRERVDKSPSAVKLPADAPKWTLKPTQERESTPVVPAPLWPFPQEQYHQKRTTVNQTKPVPV